MNSDSHLVRTVPGFISLLFLLLLTGCGEERQRSVLDFDSRNPAVSGSRFPMLYTEDGETLHMSWLSSIDEGLYTLQYASRDLFVNWADFPSIVTCNQEPVALHWLRSIEGGGPHAYDIQIAFREENTNRWTSITPHRDGTASEHGFVSMTPLDADRVLAIWLDGRETVGAHSDPQQSGADGNTGSGPQGSAIEAETPSTGQVTAGAMTLRSAVVHRDGTLSQEQVIDSTVCDCCQTDMVAVEGGAVAVYRDRTADEVRDISLVRYDSETGRWSEPVTVHDDGWQIEGCPVNGPRVASSEGDRLAVTWYTEADGERRVLAAISDDGGATFSEPVRLDSGAAIGRVDVVAVPDGGFYASWMEQERGFASVYLRRFDREGLQSEPVRVGRTDADRNSGFPRLAAMSDAVMAAWTQTEPLMRIRTVRLHYHLDTQEMVD